ncbi:MAG: hypothetical protein ACYCOU_04520 [Sulfobacillus sp.]
MKLNDDLNWAGTYTGLANGLTTVGIAVTSVVDLPVMLTVTSVAKARYQLVDNTGNAFVGVAVVTDQGHMLSVSAVGSLTTAFFKAKDRDDHSVRSFTSVHQQPGNSPTAGTAAVYLGRYRRSA